MTRNAKVLKLLDQKNALVMVEREPSGGAACASCTSGCASCSSNCAFRNKTTLVAENKIAAAAGESVVIKTKISTILTAAFMGYILPLLLFIIAYAALSTANASEKASILISVAALFVGIVAGRFYKRARAKKPGVEFEISALAK